MISWYTQVFVTLNWTFQTFKFLLRTSVIEHLEFKPRLAHGPALIAEQTSRDLGGPTPRPGAGRRQEGAGHGGQLGGGPESIGLTFRLGI